MIEHNEKIGNFYTLKWVILQAQSLIGTLIKFLLLTCTYTIVASNKFQQLYYKINLLQCYLYLTVFHGFVDVRTDDNKAVVCCIIKNMAM